MFAILLGSVSIVIAWVLLRVRQVPVDTTHNVLFITAHPDDELMFFGPTLLQEMRARVRLIHDGQPQHSKVHLLCLSHGDFYGDGHRRAEELANACQHLLSCCGQFQYKKYDDEIFKLKVLQDDLLPDSPIVNWPQEVVIKYVSEYVQSHQIGKVITFDESGVSGHLNHVAIHRALRESFHSSSVQLWQLDSIPLWRKYLSVIDLLFTGVQSLWQSNWQVHLVSPLDYLHIVQSLRQHQSQMLWFRYLYALSSRYMFINSLTRI